jgi:hypothetical protein
MKLGRIFQSKASAFNEAIVNDDVPRMRELLQKKNGFSLLLEIFYGKKFGTMTPAMAQVFVDTIDDKVLKNLSLDPGRDSRDLVQHALLAHAIQNRRLDLVDVFIEGGVNFNSTMGHGAVLGMLLAKEISEDDRLPRLRRMLAGGHDGMTGKEDLIETAIRENMPEAVDLFAAAGMDMNRNNGQYLRLAATLGLDDMARHLVEVHGVNVRNALAASRAMGFNDAAVALEQLRENAEQQAETPPTVESLSAEVKALKETVRDLTALVREMREPTLNKPALKSPGVAP